MAKIHFKPAAVTIEVRDGTTVFAAAQAAEVAIPSQCGGRCACALCRVRILEGADLVSPMQWEEAGHMGNCFHLTGERLSCQSRVYGDVVVEIDEVEVSEKPRSRYIPHSIVRKREKMEKEEELRRVRSGGIAASRKGPAGSPESSKAGSRSGVKTSSSGGKGGSSRGGRSRSSSRHRRRGRSRNPGSLRPGQTRPPAGARSADEDDNSGGSSSEPN